MFCKPSNKYEYLIDATGCCLDEIRVVNGSVVVVVSHFVTLIRDQMSALTERIMEAVMLPVRDQIPTLSERSM